MMLWMLVLPAVITLGNLEPTARLEASGFAPVAAVTGAEALFGNPAALPDASPLSLVGGYQGWYEVGDLRTLQMGAAFGRRRWAVGVGGWQKAISGIYAETHLLAAAAVRFRRVQFGLRTRWFQVSARDSSETWAGGTPVLDAGVLAHWGDASIGLHLENLGGARVRLVQASEPLARRTVLALAWRLPRNVTWSAAYVNWNGYALYRVGVEAWFTRGFALRIGVDEKYLTLGMGLTNGHWSFDFSGRNVFPMGAVYAVSVGYRL